MPDIPNRLGRNAVLSPSAVKILSAAAGLTALTSAMPVDPTERVDGFVRQLGIWVHLIGLKLARSKKVKAVADAQEGAAILYGLWRVLRDANTTFKGDCELAYHQVRDLQTFSFRGGVYTCAVEAALSYGAEILNDAWKIAGLAGNPVGMSFPFPVFVDRHEKLCAHFSRDERFVEDRHHHDCAKLIAVVQLEYAKIPQSQSDRSGATNGKPSKPPTPRADSTATLTPVSKNGKLILAALLKHFPITQTIEEICNESDLSDRTIGPELKKLIDAELAERPKGERKGATLTPTGKALAEKLSVT